MKDSKRFLDFDFTKDKLFHVKHIQCGYSELEDHQPFKWILMNPNDINPPKKPKIENDECLALLKPDMKLHDFISR